MSFKIDIGHVTAEIENPNALIFGNTDKKNKC
jgi:hypothetical protein